MTVVVDDDARAEIAGLENDANALAAPARVIGGECIVVCFGTAVVQ